MPAQPQDQDNKISQSDSSGSSENSSMPSGPNSSIGSNPPTTQDPYSTLRAEKLSSDGDPIMTKSKKEELDGTGGTNAGRIQNSGQFSPKKPPSDSGSGVSPSSLGSGAVNNNINSISNQDLESPSKAVDGKSKSDPNTPVNTDQSKNDSVPTVTADKGSYDDLPEGVKLVDKEDESPGKSPSIGENASGEMSGNKQPKSVQENKDQDPETARDKASNSSSVNANENPQTVNKQSSISDQKPQTNETSSGNETLSDVLVEMGVLERDKADEVKLAEVKTGNSQEDILKSQNLATEKEISKAKAKLYNISFIDLTTVPVDPESLNLIPQQVAEKFKIFPVSRDATSNKLVVAMADPLNLTAIEFIEQRTGMTVEPKAADPMEIENLITAGYTTSLAKEVSEALKDVSSERRKVKTLEAGRTGLIREEKVAEVVTHILGFAIKSRASDVHIEPQEHATRVRYRIDGILQEKLTIPKELHDALVSRIKILSGMKIDEKRVPQDGRFNFRSDTEEVDLRVSTLPTAWGEKIVMRLLKKSGGIPELPELGLRGRALKNLQESILRPHGIILITGPTGSGKTTTLYSIIQKINTSKVNIMTLEDPVEYKIHGVNQVQVNPGAGLTFASGMRSFLRQDPNIILVGEIRDEETAELAIQASLTGHLVFSTLHTNSAAGALPRLLDMGAEPYLLASSISAIVGQRVVRRIHQDCKTSYVPDPKVIDDVKDVLGNLWKPKPGEIEFYKGQGDQDCNNSGYHGRIGIFEVLPVSEKISRLILEQAPSGDIDKQAREEGMITMKQDGYLKVVEGITTIEEVLRVAQE